MSEEHSSTEKDMIGEGHLPFMQRKPEIPDIEDDPVEEPAEIEDAAPEEEVVEDGDAEENDPEDGDADENDPEDGDAEEEHNELDLSQIKNKDVRAAVERKIGTLTKRLEDFAEFKEEYETANSAIIEAFSQEPVVAEFMKDILQGMSLRQSINKHFDLADLEIKEGDPDEDDVKAAQKEYKEARKQREKQLKTLDDNRAESEKDAKAFVEEKGLSQAQAKSIFQKIDDHLNNIYQGRLTKDFFETFVKGLEFDQRLAAELKAVEIRMKNKKIETQRVKKESDSDGLPELTGKGKKPEGQERRTGGLFTAIDRYTQNQTF